MRLPSATSLVSQKLREGIIALTTTSCGTNATESVYAAGIVFILGGSTCTPITSLFVDLNSPIFCQIQRNTKGIETSIDGIMTGTIE